jgi:DNA-binding NarL/FixJ family response regulator
LTPLASNNGIHLHVCDDHELITESVTYLLKDVQAIKKITVSNRKAELFDFINKNPVDVLVLDINLMGENMLNNLPVIKKIRPDSRVVVLTTYNSPAIIKESMDLGVDGFVSKNTKKEELTYCIEQVLEGKRYVSRERRKEFVFKDNFELLNQLTEREIEVLKCLTKGYTNKRIADELNISVLTVQTHRKNMYSKLNLRGVNELVSFAYENNLYG